MMRIKPSILLKMMFLWPPFLGAGISVKEFNKDLSYILVQMKLRFWNKNYVGTHYGGSLYSMTDPFYMLMLIQLLNKEYIVWDKAATIRYKKPAKGKVFAKFELAPSKVAEIKSMVDKQGKIEVDFDVNIINKEGEIVAEIKKIISIKQKNYQSINTITH